MGGADGKVQNLGEKYPELLQEVASPSSPKKYMMSSSGRDSFAGMDPLIFSKKYKRNHTQVLPVDPRETVLQATSKTFKQVIRVNRAHKLSFAQYKILLSKTIFFTLIKIYPLGNNNSLNQSGHFIRPDHKPK